MESKPQTTNKERLLSLDLLRGLTVAGMILVNNGYGESFAMLQHSRWNGMTPCDLVFPFFLFIMGISCYLSLSKCGFKPSRDVLTKVLRRTTLLFAIGLFINWFHEAVKGDVLCFDHLRVWAVMQRIALCYFFVSVFALFCNHRHTTTAIVALLVAYTLIIIFGDGYSEDPEANVLARADRWVFGYEHLYHKSPVDPEGLLGTIAATAHVLLGFYCGKVIKQGKDLGQKITGLFAVGTILLLAGYLLSYGLPLNKRIWSPSYVFVSCGLAALLQALIMYIVDMGGHRRLTTPLRVFGVNALALYVASELLAIIFGRLGINTLIYNGLHAVIVPAEWASLAYAATFVGINYLIGYALYRRGIFIKL